MPLTSANTKNLTNDDIMRTLASLRTDTTRATYQAPDEYKTFLPQTLGTKPSSNLDSYYNILNGIEIQGKNATALAVIQAQNKRNKEAAQQAKVNEQNAAASLAGGGTGSGSTPGNIINNLNSGAGHGSVKGFNVNAPLKTYKWRNFNLTLNSSVASHFLGFLSALYEQGYHPVSIGSYANRNIAGTSVKSLHSLGLAIDIDPSKNPVTWNGHTVTALPPGVGALAARYGLKWGGAWVHNKRDAMHFSVPYGGRE